MHIKKLSFLENEILQFSQFLCFLPLFMPQRRDFGRSPEHKHSERAYSSPGHIKASWRMLLVADYEATQSFSLTARNFQVHEATVNCN